MPILNCYISEADLVVLEKHAAERGTTVELLAEAAISDACSPSSHPYREVGEVLTLNPDWTSPLDITPKPGQSVRIVIKGVREG